MQYRHMSIGGVAITHMEKFSFMFEISWTKWIISPTEQTSKLRSCSAKSPNRLYVAINVKKDENENQQTADSRAAPGGK